MELLEWDFEADRLTPGQWLKGRIYERRCDLSPSGRLLVYFAAKYQTELRTWTVVSPPPSLTALALWPKGDAWGGGGLFDSERHLRLNHRAGEMALQEGFDLPADMRVQPLGQHSGWGEDGPIHHLRLERGGWRMVDEPSDVREHREGGASPYWLTYDPPIRYRRDVDGATTLEMAIEAIGERDGPWYVVSYRLLSAGTLIRDFGRCDWVDALPSGQLLIARDGRLFRVTGGTTREWREASLHEVADLRLHRFEPRAPLPGADTW